MRRRIPLAPLVATVTLLCASHATAPAAPSATPRITTTRPAAEPLTLAGGVPLRLARIPAGSFVMGSGEEETFRENHEGPRRKVTISRPFLLGTCEVTRRQFAAFVAATGYKTRPEKAGWTYAWDGRKWDKIQGATWRKPGFEQTDDHPVVCVAWSDAKAFCEWLSARSKRTVRLPTEAEWEYACRAGTTSPWCWGTRRDDGRGWCNAADRTGKKKYKSWRGFRFEDGYVFTAPVGRFKPNAWGLYDMHGNVSEWCRDYHARRYPRGAATDPRGPETGTKRVVRGGSWLSSPHRVRSAFRAAAEDMGSYCDFILGFRVLVEAPGAPHERR